jgi:hypothetical protein
MSKFDFEKRDTTELPHLSLKETAKVKNPTIGTLELPAIPDKLITDDVSAQAVLVLEDLNKEDAREFEDDQDKEREIALRRRIVVQLEKLSVFLNKIWQLYKNGFPTLNEQLSVYKSTLSANIQRLENNEIATRDVIVTIYRIVLPLIIELQMQFANDQDENFQFIEVSDEIRECLATLARMVRSKSE